MTTFHDSFIKDAEHVTRLARETADALWQELQARAEGPWRARVSPPPWLQGMVVSVEATVSTRYDGLKQQAVTCILTSAGVNTAFEPLRTSIRLADATYADFVDRVSVLTEAAIYEADQRVPAQRLADSIWSAGLNNPSSRLYATFRRDFATACVEFGTRPAYGSMTPDQAKQLTDWFAGWAREHGVTVPDVSWLDGWSDNAPSPATASLSDWLRENHDEPGSPTSPFEI